METSKTSPGLAMVTVRRNPHRKARATPLTAASKYPKPSSSPSKQHEIPSFPIDQILSIQIPNPELKSPVAENLKVYLRIKPLRRCSKTIVGDFRDQKAKSRPKNVWPQIPSKKNMTNENKNQNKKIEESCITVNNSHSVTVTPPLALQELKRSKTEVYEGFSCVFPDNSTQKEVYEKMVNPLVEDFLRGKSGMLAALGPSGSGKTHTVFGSPKEPGMVPLALRRIFKKNEISRFSRLLHVSIFEIYSERGKGERVFDLLGGGASDASIKGIKEIFINNIADAESLIAQAMLKRATATTNSNSQSSRSQCIINMRVSDGSTSEPRGQPNDAVLTIVDLAGAEREKRTGNQGARLLESNFINNTSMVLGLCLRSLLEHQKNPKKTMQKHFQNSLLTRYLRDYLEGKKRMALILTVKAREEDYLDASFLLKQASPYMKIKFDNTEEPCNKRQLQMFPRVEQNKRMKLSDRNTTAIEEASGGDRCRPSKCEPSRLHKTNVKCDSSLKLDSVDLRKSERHHIIMQNFAKAIWNVLKQYKEKLTIAESEIQRLRENLSNEQIKTLQLKEELICLKSFCKCSKQELAEASSSKLEADFEARKEIEEDIGSIHEVKQDPALFGEEFVFRNALQCEVTDIQSKPDFFFESPDMEKPERTIAVGESNCTPEGCSSSLTLSKDAQQSLSKDAHQMFNCTPEGCSFSLTLSKNAQQVIHSVDDIGNVANQDNNQVCDSSSKSGNGNKVSNGLIIDDNPSKPDVTESVLSSSMGSETAAINICSALELTQQSSKEVKDKIVSSDEALPSLVLKDEVRDTQSIPASANKPASAVKPKRRLLPASSVLLVCDMNALDIEDEIEKPKANRKGKKTPAEGKLRSQGSMSLLNLLKNNLHL